MPNHEQQRAYGVTPVPQTKSLGDDALHRELAERDLASFFRRMAELNLIQGENMPDENKDAEAVAKTEITIKTIEELRNHRRKAPKGFRETLKSFAFRVGLAWLLRGK